MDAICITDQFNRLTPRNFTGWLAAAIGILLGILDVQSAAAQSGIQTIVSHHATYGESITFNLTASSSQTLTDAQLYVQAGRHRDPVIISVPVQTGPGQITASYNLPIEALQLPPFARITYHWSLRDDLGQLYDTAEENLVYEDSSVPWQWQTQSEGLITVHTDGQDPAVSRIALEAASDALFQSTQNLGGHVEGAIDIYVYPELAPMAASLRLHGEHVQDWVAAYSIPEQNAIFITSLAGPDMAVTLQRDIAHEITHLVIYAAVGQTSGGSAPGWLNEGLALIASSEPDAGLQSVLDSALGEGVLLSLEVLCASTFEGLPPHDAALAYAQSESVVRQVVDRYGYSSIRALLAAYAGGATCPDGVQSALGLSLIELESQWHAALASSGTGSVQQDAGMLPWLVVWLVSLGLAILFIQPQPHHAEGRSAYDTRMALPAISENPPGRQTLG